MSLLIQTLKTLQYQVSGLAPSSLPESHISGQSFLSPPNIEVPRTLKPSLCNASKKNYLHGVAPYGKII